MATDAERGPIVFDVERADLSVQATFRTHFWSLFHNIPDLYSALLRELGEFGVTPNSIRTDAGDGSLGAYNVNFWMLNFRVQVRIRLEQVEIHSNNITQPDAELFERAFIRLFQALAGASREFAISGYAVDLGLHGQPTGVEPREYLASFVRRRPDLPGTYIGSGVVFYYGEDENSTIRTVTADLSGALTGKVYVRIYSLLKDTVQPQTLRGVVEGNMTAALRGIGLTRPNT